MRDQRLRGAARHQFLSDVFGSSDYAHTVVREHRNYISALCTYVCVDTLCAPPRCARSATYERCYSDFWKARVRRAWSPPMASRDQHEQELVSWLRGEVQVARERVLDSGPSRADELTLEELRRPTGDTVRLRVPPRASWRQGAGLTAQLPAIEVSAELACVSCRSLAERCAAPARCERTMHVRLAAVTSRDETTLTASSVTWARHEDGV